MQLLDRRVQLVGVQISPSTPRQTTYLHIELLHFHRSHFACVQGQAPKIWTRAKITAAVPPMIHVTNLRRKQNRGSQIPHERNPYSNFLRLPFTHTFDHSA